MATAADSQGIMALPMEGAPADTGAPAQPQLGLDDSYDAVQQGLQNASPDAHTAVNDELTKLAPQLDQLPDEVLDQLLQIVQYMHDNPEEYAPRLKELVDAGIIDEGDFPDEYDPEFLATLGMVIMQARKTRQGAQQGAMPIQEAPVPPANMARGGIAEAAHMVASRGRGQDTMLAHITPREAQMLRSKGGMGTINPATGLPEYGWFSSTVGSITGAIGGAVKGITGGIKDAVKGVTSAVKSIVSSPVGRVLATVALATFLGPGAFGVAGLNLGATASMALASGAVTALGGGNIKDVLKSAAIGGATAFFGAPGGAISNYVGGAVTNAAANAAITSGIVGTGIGLLSGQKLQDAVKSGITAGAISGLSTGASKGFDAQIDAPKLETVADMAKKQAGQDVSGNALNDPNSAGASFGQTQMTNPDGTPRVELFNGRPSNMFQNQDGSITYKTVPLADRMGPPSSSPVNGQNVSANGQPLSPLTGRNVAPPTATDPLGDFIQQNDAARSELSSLANTPARVPEPSMFDKAKGLYNEYLSPSGIKEAGLKNAQAQAYGQYKVDLANGVPESLASQNYSAAVTAGTPGVFSTYGPMVGAGLGIAALGGAFTPTPPQPTQLQNDINQRLVDEKARVAANPGAYAPQGMERFGIKYNDRGEIIGSQPFNPQPTGPTEVAGNYMPYTPSPYMTPSGAIGSGNVYQPYNNANMYNFMPRYAAMGGIMDAEPMHYGFGGDVSRSVIEAVRRVPPQPQIANTGAPQAQPVVQSGNYSSTAYMPEPPMQPMQPPMQPMQPPMQSMQSMQPMQPPAQLPTEFTQYQQLYDPNQISELSRRLYPSIYDRSYRDSILSNTAMGNSGGIASLAKGGYPRRTGQISGPGTATSDSIPAMLSDGEFVMTAKAVRGAGKGDRLSGAKKMYALMHQLERNAARG